MSNARDDDVDKLRAEWRFVDVTDAEERQRIHACGRILLYARGLELDARAGLELAAESLRRSGKATELETILGHMRVILEERGIGHALTTPEGAPLASVPPIRRTSMISTCAKCLSFAGWLRQGLTRSISWAIPRKELWERQKTPPA